MKIVVQNGCDHAPSRSDVERLVRDVPLKYCRVISNISLYQGDQSNVYVKYYQKSGTLGLFCPRGTGVDKSEAADELPIALACIHDINEYPLRLSKSRRQHYLAEMRAYLAGVLD